MWHPHETIQLEYCGLNFQIDVIDYDYDATFDDVTILK